MIYYQPEFDDDIWEEKEFHSWYIFHDKDIAENAFPDLDIIEMRDNDVKDPVFVDHLYREKK